MTINSEHNSPRVKRVEKSCDLMTNNYWTKNLVLLNWLTKTPCFLSSHIWIMVTTNTFKQKKPRAPNTFSVFRPLKTCAKKWHSQKGHQSNRQEVEKPHRRSARCQSRDLRTASWWTPEDLKEPSWHSKCMLYFAGPWTWKKRATQLEGAGRYI